MKTTIAFIRIFFVLLSVLLFATYSVGVNQGGTNIMNLSFGVLGGIAFAVLLIGFDSIVKKMNLKAFNITLLGLVLGYLMGETVLLLLSSATQFTSWSMPAEGTALVRISVLLLTTYLAMTTVARASDEFHLSIPFVKMKPITGKKKDILLDQSILMDARLIDLASSGLLNHHLIIPRFILNELYQQQELEDENTKSKARRAVEIVSKLEAIPNLELRYSDTDFREEKDQTGKLVRLARLLDVNILTADISRIEKSSIEGITVINIHSLSNALKPLTQTGESIDIKIQRYGKEPRQGVGYLEDGTMVVINGGAEYIGETIRAQVLSVKHTSSGRMIFCNTMEERSLADQEMEETLDKLQNSPRKYMTL